MTDATPLASTLRAIQDVMRRDPGVDGDARRLGELAWLLFHRVVSAGEDALDADPAYRSPVPPALRWSALVRTAPDALPERVDALFRTLSALDPSAFPHGASRDRARLVQAAFADSRSHLRSGAVLADAIGLLDGLDLRAAGTHRIGDLYESLLADLRSAGNAGEFYTPRALTRFVVDRLAPRSHEVVLDPACGTGGFLVSALAHGATRVRGVEKKPLPHLLCLTNLMLHGLDAPTGVVRGNLLERPEPGEPVDVFVGNPPFGGLEERGIEDRFPPALRTRDTADLFVVLAVQHLAPTGRAALVLPDGFLFGGGAKARIKAHLLATCDLHTVLRLPPGVFAPYTSIRTNVLFFDAGRPTRRTWFYELPGPPRGFTRTRPLTDAALAPAREWWGDRREGAQAFSVSADALAARGYDLDVPNPHRPDDAPGDLDALCARFDEAEAAVDAARDALWDALSDALR